MAQQLTGGHLPASGIKGVYLCFLLTEEGSEVFYVREGDRFIRVS